jgi:hypothetical protein
MMSGLDAVWHLSCGARKGERCLFGGGKMRALFELPHVVEALWCGAEALRRVHRVRLTVLAAADEARDVADQPLELGCDAAVALHHSDVERGERTRHLWPMGHRAHALWDHAERPAEKRQRLGKIGVERLLAAGRK